jgi:hypothetical protein
VQLPQRFIELSLRSMKNLAGECFTPSENLCDATSEDFGDDLPLFTNRRAATTQPIQLEPLLHETTVIAIDVSSIRLGETETGLLCAIRGAIVWKEQGQYKYLRLGPFPFHITEENRRDIYNLFRRYSFERSKAAMAPALLNIPTRIGALFERWLQMCISHSCKSSLILWDGSLTAGTADSPVDVVSRLLEIARHRLNSVLAFSKISHLRLRGHRLIDLLGDCQPPCLLEIEESPFRSGPMRLLGDVYIAKLTLGSCSFRLDIDRGMPREQRIEAIETLLGNDSLHQSYPETLRLAHIFSTFTANEVIGIQRYVAQEWGLKIVIRPSIRRLLFGPFGKGPEG